MDNHNEKSKTNNEESSVNHGDEETENNHTTHKHGFMMTLMHMVPMIVLFSFYDELNQSENKLSFYGLILAVVLVHVLMMIKMHKRKNEFQNEQSDHDVQ